MIERNIEIKLTGGLEPREAAMIVQIASRYDSKVYFVKNDKIRVNAKSIMGMMSLELKLGEKVIIEVDGSDEEKAIDCIAKYLIKSE